MISSALQALYSLSLSFLKRRISVELHSDLSCKVFSLCNLKQIFSPFFISLPLRLIFLFQTEVSVYLILLCPMGGNGGALPVNVNI